MSFPTSQDIPPVEPAYLAPGYVAGYANYHAIRAWALTPERAIRKWQRKKARDERKKARAEAAMEKATE